jgi:hypothetical protein
MAKLKVSQIENLGIITDENGVKHIVIGGQPPITPITDIQEETVEENNEIDENQ